MCDKNKVTSATLIKFDSFQNLRLILSSFTTVCWKAIQWDITSVIINGVVARIELLLSKRKFHFFYYRVFAAYIRESGSRADVMGSFQLRTGVLLILSMPTNTDHKKVKKIEKHLFRVVAMQRQF